MNERYPGKHESGDSNVPPIYQKDARHHSEHDGQHRESNRGHDRANEQSIGNGAVRTPRSGR
jgi:hypothetical protein